MTFLPHDSKSRINDILRRIPTNAKLKWNRRESKSKTSQVRGKKGIFLN